MAVGSRFPIDSSHLNTSPDTSVPDWSLFGGAESFDALPRRTVIPNLKGINPPRGPPKDPRDFLWVITEEPHRTRRLEILKAHPEVRLSWLDIGDDRKTFHCLNR